MSKDISADSSIARLGIFGGTFNPPHLGHLIIAEEVRQNFSLDTITFVPSARPPHKAPTSMIESKCRYDMTALAIKSNPHFGLSDVEIQRPGPSYTVDTVREFRKSHHPSVEIFFIMGRDSVFEIRTWKDPDIIFQLCQVIVTSRPGFDLLPVDDDLCQRIILAEVSRIDISSTDIRQRVRAGKSIRYLVPDEVASYILNNGLYR